MMMLVRGQQPFEDTIHVCVCACAQRERERESTSFQWSWNSNRPYPKYFEGQMWPAGRDLPTPVVGEDKDKMFLCLVLAAKHCLNRTLFHVHWSY